MSAYALLKLAHVLAIVLWVGGMAFAHFFLRPAAQALEPPQRLMLLQQVLRRFLNAAAWAAAVAVGSGLALVALARGGAGFAMPASWTAMAVLGLAMAGIYVMVRCVFYPRLARAVTAKDWPAGGAAMASIRRWVGINLTLGVVVIVLAVLKLPA